MAMKINIIAGKPCFYKLSHAIAYAVMDKREDKAYRAFHDEETVYLSSGIENEYDSIVPAIDWATVNIPLEIEVEPKETYELDGLKFVKFDFSFMNFNEKDIWSEAQ